MFLRYMHTLTLFGILVPPLFNTIIPTLMTIYHTWERNSYYEEVLNSGGVPEDTFDFIIVGGGSAGSVLANRLSKHFTVLLLEREGEPNFLTAIPFNAITLFRNPDVDYRFVTKPQTAACLGAIDNSCAWSNGKALGGSSNTNFQIYLRGHPKDYDNWANITGDDRWSYRNVLPYFLKSEDYCVNCEHLSNLNSEPTFNPLFHSVNGFLTLEKSTSKPLLEEFLQANDWDGVKRTDLNAPYSEGSSQVVQTMRFGRRCSTKIAFIDPIRHRRELTIRKYARAYKLLFRGPENEAYAVQYEHIGRFHSIAFARKEIILSVGAIETPKLLILSGIGPRSHLNDLNIPVLVDLPVGKNLQDHLGTYAGPFLIDQGRSLVPQRDIKLFSVAEYFTKGTGHLTQTGAHGISVFASSLRKAQGESGWTDLQFLFSGIGTSRTYTMAFQRAYNLREDLIEAFFGPTYGRDSFSINIYHDRPKSRGEITLISNDYRDDPIIDPKYFRDPEQHDIRAIVEGLKRAVYMSENAPSFRNLNAQLSPVPFPACKGFLFRSDEYFECLARYLSLSNFHYVGTAAMGKRGSPNSVVDTELRVIGTKGLRVIDASIMPVVVSVNTNGPTIMIGERGAQLVLDTYLKS